MKTPDSVTGNSAGPTRLNWRPRNSPIRAHENAGATVARTSWNLNDAQSCEAFQISTGAKIASAITTAAHGYGLHSQRMRQRGTTAKAATAGNSITAVNFDSSASPPNTPASSHQRPSPVSATRTSDHSMARANGISATSGATLAISNP